MKFSSTKDLSGTTSNTVVVFAASDDKDAKNIRWDFSGCITNSIDGKKVNALIEDVVATEKFKGGPKEAVFFRGALAGSNDAGIAHILIVGLGKTRGLDLQAARVAAATMTKTLNREKVVSAAICMKSLLKFFKDATEVGGAFGEGIGLGRYKFDELKSKKKDAEKKPASEFSEIVGVFDDRAQGGRFEKGLTEGLILAEATNFARDLGNRPGNILTPTAFAEYAKEAAKGLPIKVTAWDKKQIQKANMGCFLGVNQGSVEEPRFIIMEYNGGRKGDKPFVMVGKGLTFDTGGISLKPGAGMEDMKFDMCGGGAVVGAIIALARMKAKVNVVTLVPSTDNMPSGSATRPGDIHTASNGKTVEVNNTDAEGRLILSDALVYACSLKPKAIIDAATLTGACTMALSNVFTGFFTRDDKFARVIEEVAQEAGEKVWRLPLTDEFVDDMKGTYGDLTNTGNAKGGGASQGAAFLESFVEKDITWAHFDIAGTAWNCANRNPLAPDKGATGVGVRMFARLAQALS